MIFPYKSYSEVSSVVSISANGGIATTGPNTEIIINGGKHISSSSTLYKSTGGKIQIIDGEFESASTFTPELLKGDTDNISISGGAFCGWDPSNTPDKQNYLALTGETTSTYVAIPNKPEPGWYFVTKRQTVTNQGNGSKENLNNAFKDPEVTIIDVTTNVDYNESFWLENRGELTINMNGNTFTGNTTAGKPGGFSGAVVYDCQLTINDANILESIQVGYSKARLILNNCNISITSLNTSDRYCIFATTNSETIYNGGTLSLVPSDGSTKKRHYFYVEKGAKIYVIDCTCGAQMSTYSPVAYGANGGTVMIYSGSFGFDPRNWATIAPGSQVKEDGSTYIVTHPCIIDAPSKPDGKKGAKRITAGEYTYPFDPTQWLGNGCEAIKNSDGTWKVSHSSK